MNDIVLVVDTEYEKHEGKFLEAYKNKKIINDLLFKTCKCDESINDIGVVFFNFPESKTFAACTMRPNKKWIVDELITY